MSYTNAKAACEKKEDAKKAMPIKAIWTIAVVVVLVAMAWFSLSTSGGFQRGIDLIATGFYAVSWTPGLIFAIWSIIMLKRGRLPKAEESLQMAIVIVLIAGYVSISLFWIVHELGYAKIWLVGTFEKDRIQVTSDGKYAYRIELINRWQRNNRTELYVKDISTGEETTMPLDISAEAFGSLGGDRGGSSMMSQLAPSEAKNIYILTTTRIFDVSGVFEIDMEAMAAVKLSTDTNYKSMSEQILGAGKKNLYTYSLLLIDSDDGNGKVDAEALLRVTDRILHDRHYISLPVDAELLKNDSLRVINGGLLKTPLWVTMEQTDTSGQFIVRTTPDLSEETTLSFLVDIYAETARKIEE